MLPKPYRRLLPLLLSATVASTWSSSAWSQIPTPTPLSAEQSAQILDMERELEAEFEGHFEADLADVTDSPAEIAATLRTLNAATGTNAAVLWAIPRQDFLHLVLVTPDGEALVLDRADVPRQRVDTTVRRFHRAMRRVQNPQAAIAVGQELYNWIVAPFAQDYLEAKGIDKILFCLGDGLRGLPIAALHDGEQFIVEKYSTVMIPAFNLIQTEHEPDRNRYILAMGTDKFTEQAPLPAVPVELASIARTVNDISNSDDELWWRVRSRLDRRFTIDGMEDFLSHQSVDIVHLATHAAFVPGHPSQSYIQFHDERLGLHAMNGLNWGDPPLELLVLSACQTAVGDSQAELGFAGMALQAGVKSALASLWSVSDAGTLALMSAFYNELSTAPTKAEALRQAQLQLIRGEVEFVGDRLRLPHGEIVLPPDVQPLTPEELAHPAFWAGFTMLSHPW